MPEAFSGSRSLAFIYILYECTVYTALIDRSVPSGLHATVYRATDNEGQGSALRCFAPKILTEKCDDAENRLRRYNLIFFGIAESNGETWGQSETQVISFCSQHLGLTINNDTIERAHRMGRFQVSYNVQ